jgi:membrane-associated phospholipid phosphatase
LLFLGGVPSRHRSINPKYELLEIHLKMEFDVSLVTFLQSYHSLLPLMRLASLFGSREFFLLLLPAVYWCVSAALGFRLGLMLTVSSGINAVCKVLWHSPRPYWVNRDVYAWASEGSFGLPSGHSQIAVSFWGLWAESIRSRRAWTAAILLSLFIGLSRIYLGAHFPGDVLAGWTIGALLLVAFCCGEKIFGERIRRQGLQMQIMISLAASLALLALFAMSRSLLAGWQMPDMWAANAFAHRSGIDPTSAKEALQAAGMLFGLGSGYALLQKRGGFCAAGPARQRALRYLLGLAGLIIIWYGLGAISPASGVLAYLRAALAGLWVAYMAPLCFMKMGLAENFESAPTKPQNPADL